MSMKDNEKQLEEVEATEIIAATVACWRAGVPTFWWGLPGHGKSALHRAIAEALDAHYEPFILSQRAAEDLGFPYDDVLKGPGGKDYKVTRRTNPMEFLKAALNAEEGKKTVFLFDELNCPDENKRGSVMTIISDRYCSDLDLASPCIILAAAGNHPGDGVGAMPLEAAMASRFCHFLWGKLPRVWTDTGIISGWTPPTVPRWVSDEEVLAGKDATAHLLVAFNRKTGGRWTTANAKSGCWGWGNSRTYDWCARALATSKAMDLSVDHEALIVEGLLGKGAGLEWAAFREETSTLMDPEEAIRMKLKGEHVPLNHLRGDLVYTLMEAVVNAVQSHPGGVTRSRWEAAFKILFQDEDMSDVSIAPGLRLQKLRPRDPKTNKLAPLPREALNLANVIR